MALAMFEMFEMSWRGVNLSTVSGSSENKNVCVYIYIMYFSCKLGFGWIAG